MTETLIAFNPDETLELSTRAQRLAWAARIRDYFAGLGLQAVFCKTARDPNGKLSPLPMAGVTGSAEFGAYADPDKGYIRPAFRVPTNAICLDVDQKPGKTDDGAATLRNACVDLMACLPPTQRLTAHGFEQESGRLLFRIPDGMRVDESFFAQYGGAVDVIRTGHRFSMAPGDIHHATGTPVVCYNPDGTEGELWPVSSWPMLPDEWIDALTAWHGAAADDEEDDDFLDKVLQHHAAEIMAERALDSIRTHDVNGSGFRHKMLSVSRTVGGFVGSLYPTPGRARSELKRAARELWPELDDDVQAMIKSGVEQGAASPWVVLPAEEAPVEEVAPRRETRPKVVEAGNEAEAADWLAANIGIGRLSGMFLRGEHVVHTPQVGEEGFQSLRRGQKVQADDYDGPAQVREMDADRLVATIQYAYQPVQLDAKGRERRILFPRKSAQSALHSPRDLWFIRDLRGVTHTPIVRADGTVLSRPGYDDTTGYLYLPMAGCGVPEVAESPTAEDLRLARKLVDGLLVDYRFTHERYRANYLTYLLVPLLRLLVPPPYPLFTFDARKPGSGKTMLAKIGHVLHGGVFRGDMPPSEEEFAKEVTTILSADTSPYVLFDNVKGALRSGKLEALLTSDEWAQRRLGGNQQEKRPNDRVWSLTANNAQLGGDLARRAMRVDINPEHAFPHMRPASSFRHPDLMGYVRAQRGELTHALLTMIRAWVVAGSPEGSGSTADNYADLVRTCNGILSHAGYDGVAGERTQEEMLSEDDRELSEFLSNVYRLHGSEPWSVKQLLESVDHASAADDFADEDSEVKGMPGEVFPSHVSTHEYDRGSATRKLGHWLAGFEGRGAISADGRLAMMVTRTKTRKGTSTMWAVATEEM